MLIHRGQEEEEDYLEGTNQRLEQQQQHRPYLVLNLRVHCLESQPLPLVLDLEEEQLPVPDLVSRMKPSAFFPTCKGTISALLNYIPDIPRVFGVNGKPSQLHSDSLCLWEGKEGGRV